MGSCPHCGASLPPVHDAFCQECFQALDEPPRAATGSASDAEDRNRRAMLGLVCGAAVGLISGCGTMVGASQSLGLIGAAGAVAGQTLVGAIVGLVVGALVGRGR
jgi:hypothetical protein